VTDEKFAGLNERESLKAGNESKIATTNGTGGLIVKCFLCILAPK
jgi:hypothetical protein